MNLHDHNLRIVDLETALTALAKSLAAAGQGALLDQAIRTARLQGVRGAEELLKGERLHAPYRRG